MKIRTDFVTNSSSSSFVVEVEVETSDSRVVFETKPTDAGANSNFKCSGEDISKVASVDELCELLQKSMSGTGKTKIKAFAQNIKDSVNDISEISSIIMRRIWITDGESSGCTVINDEVLQELSNKIAKAKGDEKESLCKKMEEYLATAEVYTEGGWQDSWPTGFCKSKAIPHYKWSHMGISVADLAKKIASGKITNDDYAVETISIDMKNKKVEENAQFILDGSKKGIDFKKAKKSSSFIRKIIENCCDEGDEIKVNVDIKEIVPDCDAECAPLDFVVFRKGEVFMVVSVKNAENSKSKTFKAIEPICVSNSIRYLLLDEKKENTEEKITAKVITGIFQDEFDRYVINDIAKEKTELDVPSVGTGHQVRVKFADNSSYLYNCFAEVTCGDIVYVGGSKKGRPGMIVFVDQNELTLTEPSSGFYCVEKILKI